MVMPKIKTGHIKLSSTREAINHPCWHCRHQGKEKCPGEIVTISLCFKENDFSESWANSDCKKYKIAEKYQGWLSLAENNMDGALSITNDLTGMLSK